MKAIFDLVEATTKILAPENKELNSLAKIQIERILNELKTCRTREEALDKSVKILQIITDSKQIATIRKRKNLFFKITGWIVSLFSKIFLH